MKRRVIVVGKLVCCRGNFWIVRGSEVEAGGEQDGENERCSRAVEMILDDLRKSC